MHITLVKIEPNPHLPTVGIDKDGQPAIRPMTSFPVDTALSYNMTLTVPKGSKWRFNAPGNVKPVAIHSSSISLKGFKLPTILRRTSLPVFFHASCRKPHGPGRDAVSKALNHLEKHANNPDQRPSELFLTGDQIYADDVDDRLLQPVINLARKILDWREKLPNVGYIDKYNSPGQRGKLVEKGFTTKHGDNHLLGFGEFAAMYLLAWSGDMWSRFGTLLNTTPAPEDAQKLFANIATYMMFDDHEITDDWNLNHQWNLDAWNDPLTRRVVSNGIISFGEFQGMGNDPGSHSYPTPPSRPNSPPVDGLAWGSAIPAKNIPGVAITTMKSSGWGFRAGTTLPTIVLDTRTHRELTQSGPFPGLMNSAARTWLATELAALPASSTKPVVIVSPAPVLGLEGWESLQRDLVNNKLDPKTVDAESWSLHRDVFFSFLDVLLQSKRRRFVFISGDVHYGFTAAGRYYRRGNPGIQLAQFTSSATKNRISKGMKAGVSVLSSKAIQTLTYNNNELKWRIVKSPTFVNNMGLITVGSSVVSQSLHVASPVPGSSDSRIDWNSFPVPP